MSQQFLGTYAPPANYEQLSEAAKLEWRKAVADELRRRAGVPPTDERGKA